MPKGKNVLTTGDVARICNVAPRTVSKWFDTGQLKGYRIPGSKDRRIPLSELIRFMKAHNMPTEHIEPVTTKVLIIDQDKPRASAMAENLIKAAEYNVMTADTLFKAGITAEKLCPEIIILGLPPAGSDIRTICREIREYEPTADAKIFALSDCLPSFDTAALTNAGVDRAISDSSDTDLVIRTIEQA